MYTSTFGNVSDNLVHFTYLKSNNHNNSADSTIWFNSRHGVYDISLVLQTQVYTNQDTAHTLKVTHQDGWH